jgi:signal transduction histidine kinase
VVATAYPRFEFVPAILATLAGWAIGSCGLLVIAQERDKWVGWLLVVAAGAWLLRGLALSDVEWLATLGNLVAWTFAAAVVTATFASPDFAPIRVTQLVGVVAFAVSLAPSGAAPSLVALVALGAVAAMELRVLGGSSRRTLRMVPTACAVGFSIVLLALPYIGRLTIGGGRIDTRQVLEIATIGVALTLTLDVIRRARTRSELTDLVLDLASRGRLDAERRTAAAVGDPGLRVGYWNDSAQQYEDSSGQPFALESAAMQGSDVTYVGDPSQPGSIIVRSQATVADPSARAALSRAVTLLSRNTALRASVQEQIAAVDSSRRRIAEAADEERLALRAELQDSLLPRVAALEAELAQLDSMGSTSSLEQPRGQLRVVHTDLLAIANGLGPVGVAQFGGWVEALTALAAQSAVPVDLHVTVGTEPAPDIAACLYFVASEGLTNAERHAGATQIVIRLAISDRARLEISDNGGGGAETRPGHGLDGLRERISATGGEFRIESPLSGGTTLVADLPIARLVDLRPDPVEEDVDLESIDRRHA